MVSPSTAHFDRAAGLITHDQGAAVLAELDRLTWNDPTLYTLRTTADRNGWTRERFLEAAVVLLAARAEDRLEDLRAMLRELPVVVVDRPRGWGGG